MLHEYLKELTGLTQYSCMCLFTFVDKSESEKKINLWRDYKVTLRSLYAKKNSVTLAFISEYEITVKEVYSSHSGNILP